MTEQPTTTAGRLLLASGLTFSSGRRLADHPELIRTIETEARQQDGVTVRPHKFSEVQPSMERILAEARAFLAALKVRDR